MLYGTLKLIFMEITRIELSLNDRVDEVLTAIRDAARRPAAAGGGGGISRSELRTTLDAVLSRQLVPLRAGIEEVCRAVLGSDASPISYPTPASFSALASTLIPGNEGEGVTNSQLEHETKAHQSLGALASNRGKRKTIAAQVAKAILGLSDSSDSDFDKAAVPPTTNLPGANGTNGPVFCAVQSRATTSLNVDLPSIAESQLGRAADLDNLKDELNPEQTGLPSQPAKPNASEDTQQQNKNKIEATARSPAAPTRNLDPSATVAAAVAAAIRTKFLNRSSSVSSAENASALRSNKTNVAMSGEAWDRVSKVSPLGMQKNFSFVSVPGGTGALLQATVVLSEPEPMGNKGSHSSTQALDLRMRSLSLGREQDIRHDGKIDLMGKLEAQEAPTASNESGLIKRCDAERDFADGADLLERAGRNDRQQSQSVSPVLAATYWQAKLLPVKPDL